MVFCKERVHISLGFPGDQEVVLVVEFEVLHGGYALSHDHFLHLFFVSFNNLIQNDWCQGCWLRVTVLHGGGEAMVVI